MDVCVYEIQVLLVWMFEGVYTSVLEKKKCDCTRLVFPQHSNSQHRLIKQDEMSFETGMEETLLVSRNDWTACLDDG